MLGGGRERGGGEVVNLFEPLTIKILITWKRLRRDSSDLNISNKLREYEGEYNSGNHRGRSLRISDSPYLIQ